MVSNRMTEGVGKKIVDALKMQSDVEFSQPQTIEPEHIDEPIILNETMPELEFIPQETSYNEEISNSFENYAAEPQKQSLGMNFANVSEQQIPTVKAATVNESLSNDFEGFELPPNVEVLRQLITKIPSNVSKQTGAQIIKQTMEALGISMKGVLQEAQQVQENLNTSARECQNNIAEYKRQISSLETQTQKLHRQYSMLNDIISLFIQAGN